MTVLGSLERGKWFRIEDLKKDGFRQVPNDAGIYLFRYAPNRRPMAIARAGRMDPHGILYVGRSGNLRTRVRTFWNGLSDQNLEVAHSAANTYVHFDLQKRFSKRWLYVTWNAMDRGREKQAEKKVLDEYFRTYFDTPPLNLTVPRLWEPQRPNGNKPPASGVSRDGVKLARR
jgi:hypothetical protein